jgi:hypothetical protein
MHSKCAFANIKLMLAKKKKKFNVFWEECWYENVIVKKKYFNTFWEVVKVNYLSWLPKY